MKFEHDEVHLKKITCINRDKRNSFSIANQILMMIQQMTSTSKIFETSNLIYFLKIENVILSSKKKLFILKNRVFTILITNIMKRFDDIYLDWAWVEKNENIHISSMYNKKRFVKRIINFKTNTLKVLNLSTSLKIELKMKIYEREHFELNFFDIDVFVFFFSFMIFMNDFDFFKKYHFMFEIYVIFSKLNLQKRIKKFNVFTLTFDFHDATLLNVIDVMHQFLHNLNKNVRMNIDDQKSMMCAYTFAFIENMSQQ